MSETIKNLLISLIPSITSIAGSVAIAIKVLKEVKNKFRELATGCTCPPEFPICVCGKTPRGKLVNTKPILPGERECEENKRAKSAKLRVIEKL